MEEIILDSSIIDSVRKSTKDIIIFAHTKSPDLIKQWDCTPKWEKSSVEIIWRIRNDERLVLCEFCDKLEVSYDEFFSIQEGLSQGGLSLYVDKCGVYESYTMPLRYWNLVNKFNKNKSKN